MRAWAIAARRAAYRQHWRRACHVAACKSTIQTLDDCSLHGGDVGFPKNVLGAGKRRKRVEIAADLSKCQERSELFQEARLDFGAERWGLIAGGNSSSAAVNLSASAGSGELPDDDEEEVI